jgi:hypothetical protein
MDKIAKQFEPCYFGNGWGNYADIENYEYNLFNLQRLPLVKKVSQNYYDNTNKNNPYYKQDKVVTSLIIKVSSTTFVTLLLSYFVYRAI